jgi:hypothetical protein
VASLLGWWPWSTSGMPQLDSLTRVRSHAWGAGGWEMPKIRDGGCMVSAAREGQDGGHMGITHLRTI